MRRSPRRARCARDHDAQHLSVLVLVRKRAEAQQLFARVRREPAADVRRRAGRVALSPLEPRERIAQVVLETERVVAARLDPHQQAVERRDVDADRIVTGLERLHQRRARACERVEHASADGDVASEELLDQLRDVFPEIRMQAMDVLRPHALGEVTFRPRQVEVEALVDLLLGDAHEAEFAVVAAAPRTRPPGARSSRRARRSRRSARRGRRAPGGARARPPQHGARGPLSVHRPSPAGRRTRSPLFDFTSQNTRTRPRRAITSISAPASQQLVSRMR